MEEEVLEEQRVLEESLERFRQRDGHSSLAFLASDFFEVLTNCVSKPKRNIENVQLTDKILHICIQSPTSCFFGRFIKLAAESALSTCSSAFSRWSTYVAYSVRIEA